jgi:DNA-binding NarL/FixJ family response regulator
MVKVHIVDDSVLIRERLKFMISEIPGAELTGTDGSPLKAGEAFKEKVPDVVILDIRMPGKSGIELLRDIKKMKPSVVVIIFTNYPFPQYRERCIKAGADYFLNKSTEFETINDIIKKIIRDSSSIGNGCHGVHHD